MVILIFNLFITMMGTGILIPIMPEYLGMFGAGGQVYGYLIAVFSFAQFALSPLAGQLSDRYGRKPFIIWGLILLGIAAILFALAGNIPILFIARFLMGVGAAFVVPTIMAYAADVSTIDNRGKIMSWLGAGMSLGLMLGPGIGGFLAEIHIVFPFYFSGVISMAAAIITYYVFKDVKRDLKMETELKRQKRVSIVTQLKHSLKTEYFILLLIVFVFSLGLSNFQVSLSLYLDGKFGYSPLEISIFLLVSGFVGVILQLFVLDKLFKKFGEMKVILVCLLMAVITMLLMIYVNTYFGIMVVVVAFTVATTFIRPAVNTVISEFAGNEQGYAAGMNNAYMSLGTTFGPIMAGILYDWHMDSPYMVGSIILFLSLVICFIWTRSKVPYLMNRR